MTSALFTNGESSRGNLEELQHKKRQQQQQRQRILAFRQLLDPTDLLPGHRIADLYSLRHLCLQGDGIPDAAESSRAPHILLPSAPASRRGALGEDGNGWLRAQAWRVLLGYLGPEKGEWSTTLEKRRSEYYRFVEDLLPDLDLADAKGHATQTTNAPERDSLIQQIYRDLVRSRKNAFAFYRQEVPASYCCPLAKAPSLPKQEGRSSTSGQCVPRIKKRHALLDRLRHIDEDYARSLDADRHVDSPQNPSLRLNSFGPVEKAAQSQESLGVSPTEDFTTPNSELKSNTDLTESPFFVEQFRDLRWHSLLRVLYIYATLNPGTGYVQGMNEILFVVLYVMGTSASPPMASGALTDGGISIDSAASRETSQGGDMRASTDSTYLRNAGLASHAVTASDFEDDASAHAEADAFWCFSALIGEVRDLYDFDEVDASIAGLSISDNRANNFRAADQVTRSTSGSGLARALRRLSLRLCWLDEELWSALQIHALDPNLPYYSLRWLTCLLSTELSLPSILRVWDGLLSESNDLNISEEDACAPKIEFLIDICASLLISLRTPLLVTLRDPPSSPNQTGSSDAFARAMEVLQRFPDDDIGTVMENAFLTRQRRLAAPLTGDGPPQTFPDEMSQPSFKNTMSTLRGWAVANSTTPRKPSWLSAVPRKASDGNEDAVKSTPPSARLQRYADAFNASDAVASLSKASSNWQARAMARRVNSEIADAASTKETSEDLMSTVRNAAGQTRNISLSTLRQQWYSKQGASDLKQPNALLAVSNEPHPALRWSQTGAPPDLPLPDLADSPPGREQYWASPKLSSPGGFSALGKSRSRPSSPVGTSTEHHADAAVFGRFAHLPSLVNAQNTPKTPPHTSNGPKPLLLLRSAGPPRESPMNDRVRTAEPMSRKISSGPLAAAAAASAASGGSSTSSQGALDGDYRAPLSARWTPRSSASNGHDKNIKSQIADRSVDTSVLTDDSSVVMHETDKATLNDKRSSLEDDYLSAALGYLRQASPSPPPLPSKVVSTPANGTGDVMGETGRLAHIAEENQITRQDSLEFSKVNEGRQGPDTSSVSPQALNTSRNVLEDSFLGNRQRPIASVASQPSSHIRRPMATTSGSEEPQTGNADAKQSNSDVTMPRTKRAQSQTSFTFGDVASSSDIPLTQSSSLQRKPRRKISETTVATGGSTGTSPEGDMTTGTESRKASISSRYSGRGTSHRGSAVSIENGSGKTDAASPPTTRRIPLPAYPNGNYI